MDFCLKESAVAGSLDSILADKGVSEVFGTFGDCYMSRYGMDIRSMRSIYNQRVARQVKSFVGEYGVEDSVAIIRRLYSPAHNGSYRGEAVGISIFSKGRRWLANILLMESYDDRKPEGIPWKSF